MSSRTFRCILAGTLVISFLSLAGPLPVEAADSEDPAAPAALVLAWQWLTAQIFPADETAGSAAVAPDQSATDAGWVIDPDG